MMRAILMLSILVDASPALAYHQVFSFDQSANIGGGAGAYYTGSPRFKGYDCTLCHEGAEQRISIALSGSLVSGTYEPGLVYRIGVKLVGEHRGLGSAFNPNTFTAAITDDSGVAVGTFASSFDGIVEVVDEGRVAVAQGLGEGEDEWILAWAAPVDAVPARLYIAMLDGDGASDPETRFIDPFNDDFAAIRLDLCPAGMVCPEPSTPQQETSAAGCSVGRAGPSWVLPLLISMVALLRRRRCPRLAPR